MFCEETAVYAANRALRKLGVSEEKLKAILPETVLTAENYSTEYGINGCFRTDIFTVEAGKKYRAVVDGLSAEFVASDNAYVDGVGNLGILGMGAEDNGFPWLVGIASFVCCVGFLDPAENAKTHTMAVYEIVEEFHPIDQKYLPEGIGGGVDVEMSMEAYGFAIGQQIVEAFSTTGFSSMAIPNVGNFWSDFKSKNPYPVCSIDMAEFGIYKGTPICMSDDFAAFKMEAIDESYRMSIDTLIQKNGEAALVFVYVNRTALVPQG